ncbi:MAG: glycoside hydrolase superfamily [Monoraphidium minutum]|nr:MAG: glycoside hydrolase superfamily [Monoraphidium minutum]
MQRLGHLQAAFVDNRIIDEVTGQPVTIRGVNWFGFNVGMGAVDGLWAGGTDQATDFLEMVRQIRVLGFNAVRLPFRFEDLRSHAPDRTRHCRPSPEWQLKRRLTDPLFYPSAKALPPPAISIPRPGGPKACNSYFPEGTGLDRLMWTLQIFNANGIYVILDYHASSGSALETDAISSADLFASRWSEVWRAVACVPRFQQDLAGRVLVDVLNEPDMLSLKWGPIQGLLTPRPNWGTLALAAMDRIHAASPGDALFLVSGTDQSDYGLNWGNGFVSDPQIIADYGLGDPNPFLRQLVARPYANLVAVSPHVYPPSITGATYLGRQLAAQLDNSFGYLQTKGYCGGGGGGSGQMGVQIASSEEGAGAAEALLDEAGAAPAGAGAAAGGGGGGAVGGGEGPEAGAQGGAEGAAGVGGGGSGGAGDIGSSEESVALSGAGGASASNASTSTSSTPTGAASAANATSAAAAGAAAAAAAPRPSRRRALLAARRLHGAGACTRFPVVISEFGSSFEQAGDITWLGDFAAWVAQQSKAAGAPVGWLMWAVNANSGDTGGLVSPSWQGLMWVKVRFLVDRMGLVPWYL